MLVVFRAPPRCGGLLTAGVAGVPMPFMVFNLLRFWVSSCCSECGTVVNDLAFSQDVQFTKDASGAAAPSAKFIKDGTTYSGRVGRDGREYGPSVGYS